MPTSKSKIPEISVIICTFNRVKYLTKTLESFAKQTAKKEKFELLIIDNNSTDATKKASQDFISKASDVNTRYLLEMSQGLSYARNRGIVEATSTIICFVDDDVLVNDNFVEQLIESFQNTDAIALGGKVLPHYENGDPPKWMSKYLLPTISTLDMGSTKKIFKWPKFPIGANMAFRKEAFEKHGDFNTQLGRSGIHLEGGDEKDIFNRLMSNGEKILYSPSVFLQHVIPEKRLQKKYIKNLALGVGTSEMKRLRGMGLKAMVTKWMSEFIKIGGTFVLFFFYSIQLKFAAACMLVKFRFWVLKGMLSR